MIAPLRTTFLDRQAEFFHERFLAMLPQIRRQASVALRGLRPEVRQELTQEVEVNAYLRICAAGGPRQSGRGVSDAIGSVCTAPNPRRTASRLQAEHQ